MSQEPLTTTTQPPKGADPRLTSPPARSLPLGTLILAGGLTAALFGSRVLLQEIQSQPDMFGFETITSVGAAWNNAMQDIRATVPDRVLHDAIRSAEAK